MFKTPFNTLVSVTYSFTNTTNVSVKQGSHISMETAESIIHQATDSPLLVAAIDFGTSGSGWAFSIGEYFQKDPTNVFTKHWSAETGSLVSVKAPTCLLVHPDGKTMYGFGYDAENKYRMLTDKNEHSNYYYFKHFKMALMRELGKGVDRTLKIKEEMGKEMLAVDVFAMSIRFLKDDLMESVNKQFASPIDNDDVCWVLTVPAIWSDAAKQFMKEAAEKAGIKKKNILLALEPEAASIYCRRIPLDKSIDTRLHTIAELPVGTKYLVFDAGGGTIDITVHQIQDSHTLREAHAASGGAWGGKIVDDTFEDFLRGLVGQDVYKEFKEAHAEDWLDLLREFETRKRHLTREGRLILRCPLSLPDLYSEKTGKRLGEHIKSSKYAKSLEFDRDKFKMEKDMFKSFFTESLQMSVSCLKSMHLDDVKIILMVGGFSESVVLQEGIKAAFPDKQIVVPIEPASAVLRGAVIFGHSPDTITERILRYTYGVKATVPFDAKIHRASKLLQRNDGDYCRDIFGKIVTIDECVRSNESQYTIRGRSLHQNQRASVFEIYATDRRDPEYVDDAGCTCIGEVKLQFDETSSERREVNIRMMFGGTTIVAEAEDAKTGKKSRAVLNFLG